MAKNEQRLILGIDTSCDETSLAVFDAVNGVVLANVISSQVGLHAAHGGVVPELASRAHAEILAPLFEETLKRAGVALGDIGAVAVTNTPGLIGCLLIGVSFAKALAFRLNVPLIAVNHLQAHLFSPFIGKKPEFPFLGLVVSGGHTAFYRVDGFDDVTLLGQTVDDAAGEAFDKTAKLMGLGYPGGPVVDKLADGGDPGTFPFTIAKVKMGEEYLSFSGLKTAVVQHWRGLDQPDDADVKNMCASLRNAIVETLVRKAEYFLDGGEYRSFGLSGGVAMNSLLRTRAAGLGARRGIPVMIAEPEHCTDNAAMVAYLAAFRSPEPEPFSLGTVPSKKIRARELKRGR
jgi:N6-L-threonylcarbamoyladenine synthase